MFVHVCYWLIIYPDMGGQLIKSFPGSMHKVIIEHGCISTKKKKHLHMINAKSLNQKFVFASSSQKVMSCSSIPPGN